MMVVRKMSVLFALLAHLLGLCPVLAVSNSVTNAVARRAAGNLVTVG